MFVSQYWHDKILRPGRLSNLNLLSWKLELQNLVLVWVWEFLSYFCLAWRRLPFHCVLLWSFLSTQNKLLMSLLIRDISHWIMTLFLLSKYCQYHHIPEQQRLSLLADNSARWCSPFQHHWHYPTKLHIILPHDPANALLIAKKEQQPRCLSTNDRKKI